MTSMKARTGGLTTANQNAQDCVSYLQLRDAAMAEVNDCINRIRELAVRAANEATLTADDRQKMQAEAGSLVNQINQINTTVKFNGMRVFGPGFSEVPGGLVALVHPGQVYISVDLASMAIAGVVEINGCWFDGTDDFPDFNLLSPDGTEAFGYLYATYGAPGVTAYLGGGGTVSAPAITSATSVNYSGWAGYAGSGGWDEESFTITDPAPGQWTIIIDNERAGAPLNYGVFFNEPPVEPEEKDRGQIGADNDENTQVVRLGMFEVSSFALGVSASFTSTALAQASINSLDNALDSLNNRRADTGTMINRIEHIINDNMAEVINVEASRSRIEDTDMAREIVDYTKSQLLNQTGIDTTRIANMSGQTALDLVGMTLQSVGSKVG